MFFLAFLQIEIYFIKREKLNKVIIKHDKTLIALFSIFAIFKLVSRSPLKYLFLGIFSIIIISKVKASPFNIKSYNNNNIIPVLFIYLLSFI